MHIEMALAGVPKSERCSCREAVSTSAASTSGATGNDPARPK
jgi:hypothetical protein